MPPADNRRAKSGKRRERPPLPGWACARLDALILFPGATLVDRFGPRRVALAGLALFGVGAELHGRYASVPFDAGGSLTLQEPTNHPLSQQVDR